MATAAWNPLLVSILSLTILPLAATGARAADAPTPTTASSVAGQAPAIVVTATRDEADASRLPQAIVVVTHDDIDRRQERAPSQMLRETVGVYSAETAAQGTPIIRGLNGNHVLYLYDGIRINNGAIFGGPNGNFNQTPVGAIERIEVVRGPGSVQYGSDAMGGVINVIPKRRIDFPDRIGEGGDIHAFYGTVDPEKTAFADGWVAGPWFAAQAGLTGQDVNDYKGPGVGTIQNTGFEANGGYADIALQPVKDQVVRFSFMQGERTNVEYYASSKINPAGFPGTIDPYEQRRIAKLDYDARDLAPLLSDLHAYTYWHQYTQARVQTSQTTATPSATISRTRTGATQATYGFGLQGTIPFALVGDDKLILGTDYRYDNLDSMKHLYATNFFTGNTTTTIPNGNTADGIYDVFDAFATLELDPVKQLSILIGGRFESTHLHSHPELYDVPPNSAFTINDLKLDKRWNSGTWSVGATYWLTDHLGLAGDIATAFRAPDYSDALSGGSVNIVSHQASLPNPDIDPEHSITYEGGPRWVSDDVQMSVVGYWTEFTDLITSVPSGTINLPGFGTVTANTNQNSSHGHIEGIEASASVRFLHDFTAFGNVTFTRGQDEKANVPLNFIPPINGLLGLRYERPDADYPFWVEGTVVMFDRLRRPPPNVQTNASFVRDPGFVGGASNPPLRADLTLPGYAVMNLRAGVQVWKNESARARVTLDLNNIFNTKYREAHAQQELVAPGLNGILGLEISF